MIRGSSPFHTGPKAAGLIKCSRNYLNIFDLRVIRKTVGFFAHDPQTGIAFDPQQTDLRDHEPYDKLVKDLPKICRRSQQTRQAVVKILVNWWAPSRMWRTAVETSPSRQQPGPRSLRVYERGATPGGGSKAWPALDREISESGKNRLILILMFIETRS
jgi:hypothetical protein